MQKFINILLLLILLFALFSVGVHVLDAFFDWKYHGLL